MKEITIVANGTVLPKSQLIFFTKGRSVLALDGAYDTLMQAGIPVDYLLGDLDSLSSSALEHARANGVSICPRVDQSKTDLEKALIFLHELDATQTVNIICATGMRMDHTLYNIRLLSRYYDLFPDIRIHTLTETIAILVDSHQQYSVNVGDGFAVLGAPECVVTSKGLQYDMASTVLRYQGINSTSNTCVLNDISLHVSGRALVIHEPLSCLTRKVD